MRKVILHVDGDSFFASCESSLNPRLRGLPVVTGHERGIATSMSKEAKALGVSRGMPVFKIKKLFPQVIILHSDYSVYEMFAQRMYAIVRRFTPYVEEYSIDECFADLTGFEKLHGDSFEILAREIKNALQSELGITFSIGVAPSKVLAKVASKRNKPDGLTVLTHELIPEFLKNLQIGSIWGIGPSASFALQKLGIKTAGDFVSRSREWVEANLSKPHIEIWHELRGESLHQVSGGREEDQKSIQMTRTFSPPSRDKKFIMSELSKNIEGACSKARMSKLSARRIYFFLKTQEFRYHRFEIPLVSPISLPNKVVQEVLHAIDSVYQPNTLYRATGVTLAGLVPEEFVQKNLFSSITADGGTPQNAVASLLSDSKRGGVESWNAVFKIVDKLDRRYGSHTVTLASSLEAFKRRNTRPQRRLKIPYMGEVV